MPDRSSVAQRLEWLDGSLIEAVFSHPHSTDGFITVQGVYLDTLPLGRGYAFRIEVDGISQLFATDRLVSIKPIGDAP